MTISVGDLFKECGLSPGGVVKWGDQIPLDLPGVYVVASTRDLDDPTGLMRTYRHDPKAFLSLKTACPSVTIEGRLATHDELSERIGAFWIPDSAILYVGLAGTSVRKRVNQYYITRIGQRSPHAGGWWLKTLADLETLFVHYAASDAPKSKEALMLKTFSAAVPPSVRQTLHDSERIAPFANVDAQAGFRKRHGLCGYKTQRANPASSPITVEYEEPAFPLAAPISARPTLTSSRAAGSGIGTRIESQVITENDRTGSNLRIPSRSKFALPTANGFLSVTYQGQRIEARWRVNGSRSGTIGLGRSIMSSIGGPNRSIWMQVSGRSVVIEES
ncbi:hypothetical protein [Pseudarthrobacter sp. PvP090]|uniref:hypothetical protein n=1 Tax=Pseudarthrobacter sp. PvP090 TaxID=3156393 RepID=UPI003395F5BB